MLNKQGCVFQMVIWPAFRMEKYRINDHPYHAPQFMHRECIFDSEFYFEVSERNGLHYMYYCSFDPLTKSLNGYFCSRLEGCRGGLDQF